MTHTDVTPLAPITKSNDDTLFELSPNAQKETIVEIEIQGSDEKTPTILTPSTDLKTVS